jgi:hypothetical protein
MYQINYNKLLNPQLERKHINVTKSLVIGHCKLVIKQFYLCFS